MIYMMNKLFRTIEHNILILKLESDKDIYYILYVLYYYTLYKFIHFILNFCLIFLSEQHSALVSCHF